MFVSPLIVVFELGLVNSKEGGVRLLVIASTLDSSLVFCFSSVILALIVFVPSKIFTDGMLKRPSVGIVSFAFRLRSHRE